MMDKFQVIIILVSEPSKYNFSFILDANSNPCNIHLKLNIYIKYMRFHSVRGPPLPLLWLLAIGAESIHHILKQNKLKKRN